MVDEDKQIISEFGFTNQDGDIESVTYDECDEVVDIVDSEYHYRVYPQDVVKLIKALQMTHQYLIEQKIIQELKENK